MGRRLYLGRNYEATSQTVQSKAIVDNRISVSRSSHPIIDISELNQWLTQEEIIFFDCRFYLTDVSQGRREYDSNHIPGAIYLDLATDLSGPIGSGKGGRHPLPDASTFLSRMARLGVSTDSVVVAYDQSGGAYASRLWWMLKALGFETVFVLNGGWNAWTKEGDPHLIQSRNSTRNRISGLDSDTKSYLDLPSGLDGTDGPPRFPHLSTSHVVNRKSDLVLVDSRTHDRYMGLNETIDPIAGHIPGALNIPWTENVDEAGYFLPPELLKKRFEGVFSLDSSPVFYCGSGVTACQNILATQIAGFPMPGLYAASWSGWINQDKQG